MWPGLSLKPSQFKRGLPWVGAWQRAQPQDGNMDRSAAGNGLLGDAVVRESCQVCGQSEGKRAKRLPVWWLREGPGSKQRGWTLPGGLQTQSSCRRLRQTLPHLQKRTLTAPGPFPSLCGRSVAGGAIHRPARSPCLSSLGCLVPSPCCEQQCRGPPGTLPV